MPLHTLTKHLLPLALLALLLLPDNVRAEFYSYEDNNGTVHFVDDPSRIPGKYRQKTQVRKDKYDDLPEEERAQMLETDRRERETARRAESAEAERRRTKRVLEAQEEWRKSLSTKVVIQGRQVFVPVKLMNGGAETEAMLLLDTGATASVISPEVAARLNIEQADNVRVKVVGGRVLQAKRAFLEKMTVGPVVRAGQEVTIISQRGGGFGDGLLGMSFLGGLKYTIDFRKQTLNWIP